MNVGDEEILGQYPASFPTLLFTYGSLRKDGYLHGMLKMSKLITNAYTYPVYTLYAKTYPWLVLGGHTSVHGEVYKVSKQVFDEIHDMEIDAGYFCEEVICVKKTIAGVYDGYLNAYMFIAKPSLANVIKADNSISMIESGDYIQWLKQKQQAALTQKEESMNEIFYT